MSNNDVPVYGLDKEIKMKMDGKVSAEQVDDTRRWIEQVLGRDFPTLDQPTLKDGTVLLELLAKVTGDAVKIQRSNMPFKQMENISMFLKGAEGLGCKAYELFQTVDLYEDKNFGQVVIALSSFARHAHKAGKNVPLLGPKLNDKHETNFSDEQINAGRNMPSLLTGGAGIIQPTGLALANLPRQAVNANLGKSVVPNLPTQQTMGSHGGATASGVIHGLPRQVVYKNN
ncbi:calponin homology domain-containing protein [Catenaria anguillulae PL171]|uniref:Calponin homology domain-containing protein n=1 Tax=Catenaria anguillulae PL171 TaxID=765915 RepID=A0A1Y2HMG2_9FUNG|nr:calponin homology domain-containing protein [Catenaria anguillulae PL171]